VDVVLAVFRGEVETSIRPVAETVNVRPDTVVRFRPR
jgi:hypothetical protein